MPPTDRKSEDTNNLLPHIIKGIQDRKGKDIGIMDLREISNAMWDYFVICSGTSDTNIQAIKDNVEKVVWEEMKEKAAHIEGYSEAKWVLMDYFDILVHVFNAESRTFYDLENLWADAKSEHLTDLI
jgi:ribosome-associated protein